ncbi:hypothetical protein F5Y01DRAFT_319033 [Xylaria sp. FL0043]|nr:hypothetical protein F5Y01DRAFT_319033 [Xylaria sp. FL0043]
MPRIRPTVESHLELHTPELNPESGDWAWPYWKFGFESPAVLFNDLHAEYNSIRCAIQDPQGWYSDVRELADVAENREQFLALLRKRQDDRFKELEGAWHKISVHLLAENSRFLVPREKSDYWMRFLRITRNFSYDAFVGYFGAYVQDEAYPSSCKPPVEPGHSDGFRLRLQQAGSNIRGQTDILHPAPEMLGTEPLSPDAMPSDQMQLEDNGAERDEPAGTGESIISRVRSKPEVVDHSTQTTPPRPTRKAGKAKRPSLPVTESPHRVVKRQTRRSKPAASNPEGLRRSARLQQRAERGKK